MSRGRNRTKKRRKKKLKKSVKIFIVVFCLLLIGGGYVGYNYYLSKTSDDPHGVISDASPEDNEGGSDYNLETENAEAK